MVSGVDVAGAAGSEEGWGMFSASEVVSEGFWGVVGGLKALGLLRRAQTESMSIVAPVVLARGLFLDSSLWG